MPAHRALRSPGSQALDPREARTLVVDEWIVGYGPHFRSYVIHTAWPRFVAEIVELGRDEWKVGELAWQDRPRSTEVGSWEHEAGEAFFSWIQRLEA